MQKYDPKSIEQKWQHYWEDQKTFEVTEDQTKKKFYSLIEFPYPSGAGLHVGHPRPFTAMDVVSRKKRMDGYNVLYPIGFDAFGLPTENFAIKTGRPPAEVTAENIANFTRQLKMLGYSFDWSRSVDTTDPQYFKWTQWLFLQFYKHGLAYKKNMPINWCLSCKIGLANEEVVDGKCERCGGDVEKRDKEQWMLAITKYADSLLEGLEDVDYISQAKIQQQNWIGRSEGAEVRFALKYDDTNTRINANDANEKFQITVFTTRPDTLFGATYMVVAPEHNIIKNLKSKITNYDDVEAYVKQAALKSDLERTELQKEKTGVELKGIKAINPVNNEEIPVFVADYVLASYGTGAIMAVPAHDERDFEFAKKYGIEIKEVVAQRIGEDLPDLQRRDGVAAVLEHGGKICVLFDDVQNCYRLPAGGFDDEDEDDIATLTREIKEETGYQHFEIDHFLGSVFAQYYAPAKDLNRVKAQHAYVVHLTDEKQEAQQLDDTEHYDVQWHTPQKALELLKKNSTSGEYVFVERYVAVGQFMGFFEEGVAINSGFLNGLETAKAKEKMITWLEEKGIGVRKTQYKLRDWVFSRQRYWGEPIPLVYCEHCKEQGSGNNEQKFIILHAFGADSQDCFYPWLKHELEQKDHTVYVPDLPNTDHPNIDEWVDTILNNYELDENTTIVTHSLGGVAALKLFEKTDKKIHKLVLIATPLEVNFKDGKERPVLKNCCDWTFDFDKVSAQVDHISVIRDIHDHILEPYHSENIAKKLHVPVVAVTAQETHFDGTQESVLLDYIFDSEETHSGWIPLPEDQLPLELPHVEKYEPTDTGESPLAAMEEWVNTTCPQCGGPARRETDTMPNWAGSSWYFLRYMDPHNDTAFASRETLDYWAPVDWYNGGMEHTVLHLLYSRFWNQFLYDIGLVPTKEPYKKRTSHGMILASDGEKMSKSRGNVINPDDMVDQFGTDAFRTYILFMGPFDQAVAWDTDGVKGVRRFIERVWNVLEKVESQKSNVESLILDKETHKTIKKVGEDIEGMSFNTAVAKLMELTNVFTKAEKISLNNYESLIKLLSPFAPHVAEELWQRLGHDTSIAYEPWPEYDETLIVDDEITLAVQVNGKLRATITVPADISDEDAKRQALAEENVVKWMEGRDAKKVIYVKGKLVSVVV